MKTILSITTARITIVIIANRTVRITTAATISATAVLIDYLRYAAMTDIPWNTAVSDSDGFQSSERVDAVVLETKLQWLEERMYYQLFD